MSNIVLDIENVSKQYRLGEVGTGTLSNDLKRWWFSVRGKEDPFLKIGETNDRTQKGESDYVWALRDINFQVEQGQAVGIIGRNGAGKSTLLKLLSRVTKPTTGTIKYKGRIASLLEVGTGFHPEMTGRENVYLNGAILGMTRSEISRKFDEIVDFAGVERYIDTPVKRYSSGMTVRLGFAVAAFLEAEILVVDEVLAVGDAEFQRKCIGKMGDVSKGDGRTVLFVSHNMASIKSLCDSGLLLDNGQIYDQGSTDLMIKRYEELGLKFINESSQKISEIKRPRKDLGLEVKFIDAKILDSNNTETKTLKFAEPFKLRLYLKAIYREVQNIQLGVRFETGSDIYIASCLSSDSKRYFDIKDENNDQYVEVSFNEFYLTPGEYYITLSARKGKVFYDQVVKAVHFEILDYSDKNDVEHNNAWGLIKVESEWH